MPEPFQDTSLSIMNSYHSFSWENSEQYNIHVKLLQPLPN